MAERVTYVALSFFCLFFVGHGRENKDAEEQGGQIPAIALTAYAGDFNSIGVSPTL